MTIGMHDDGVDIILAHGYDNLFPRGAFSGHVNLRTYLLLVSYVILCISMIFFVGNLGKASFIFNMSSVLPLVACTKDLMFLWCLDFAKTLALGLGGIGGGILDILARLVLFLFSMVSMFFIINCEVTC